MIRIRNYISTILLIVVAAAILSFGGTHNTGDSRFVTYIVDPKKQDIRLYWKNDKGETLKSMQNLKSWLDKKNKKLIFAMNAGMYKEDNPPISLAFCQVEKDVSKDQIKIKISLLAQIYQHEDLALGFSVINVSGQSLLIDTFLTEKILQLPESNYDAAIQKKKVDRYVDYNAKAFIDPAPKFEEKERTSIISLRPNKMHIFKDHLDELYQFTKGEYRIKIEFQYKDSASNTEGVANSDWRYFTVKNDLLISRPLDTTSRAPKR